MNRIEHFMLPEHTNKLYTEEAISSISLIRDVADKINELVDAYNHFSKEDLVWKHEQEGRIRKGVLYMKDNLLNSLNELLSLYDKDVIQNAMMEEFKNLKIVVTPQMFGAVGNGITDDSNAFQSAIDTVHALGGGIVMIPASDNPYIFTSIELKENVTLKGNGGVLKLRNYYCVDEDTNYYLIFNSEGADNVSIIDVIIDGNSAKNTKFKVADTITITGKNAIVKGCKIFNPPDSGIMFSCVENSICSENVIYNATDCGIYVNNNGLSDLKMGSICENNMIENCYTGIALKRVVQNFSVKGNTIKKCEYGITHENASEDNDFSSDTIISDNMILNVKCIGVILRGSEHCNVRGNYIDGFMYSGVELQGASNNIVANNNFVTSINSTKRHGGAIFITPRSDVGRVSTHNVISGNAFDINFNSETYHFSFIAIIGETNYKCNYNVVTGNTGNGKLSRGLTAIHANNNQFANNILHGCNLSGVLTGNSGNLLCNNFIDGETTNILDSPILAITPYGQRIYINLLSTEPNFTANEYDICLAKTPSINTNNCIGWVYNDGTWKQFGEILA